MVVMGAGGIGSLTSAGCQILFKVEAGIHFFILASFTWPLPKRQRNSNRNYPCDFILIMTKN